MAAEPSNAENSAPLEATASAWLARRDRGLTATVRVTKGLDIDAACGQLGERPSA